MSRDIIRTRLVRGGHEVTAVCNGEECLATANVETFDLIILDLSMPVKDGLQTIKELKTKFGIEGIPVLALSAHSMDRDKQKAIAAGFDDFDTKPLNHARLLDKINKLISSKD